MTGSVAITLILIAIGVFFFVKTNTIEDGYDILLQVKDYTPQNKLDRLAYLRNYLRHFRKNLQYDKRRRRLRLEIIEH